MDLTSAIRIPEWGEDTRIGRSQRSERHNVIRPSRRSVLFGGIALGVSLAATGANLLATVIPTSAYPPGFKIRGFTTSSGPCGPRGWVNRGRSREENNRRSCSPGCGPSVVYGDACNTSGRTGGFHRGNTNPDSWVLASGAWWSLRPGECMPSSKEWDGWKWSTDSTCAECTNKYWRCHDGYMRTDDGTTTSICRWCVSYGGNDEGL